MRGIAAEFVPLLPSNDQRDRWVEFYIEFREAVVGDLNFSKIITDDETWTYGYGGKQAVGTSSLLQRKIQIEESARKRIAKMAWRLKIAYTPNEALASP